MIMDFQVNNLKYINNLVILMNFNLSLYIRSLFVGIVQFYSEMLSDII